MRSGVRAKRCGGGAVVQAGIGLARLEAAVDALLAEPLVDYDLGDYQRRLRRCVDRILFRTTVAAGEFASAGGGGPEGPVTWLTEVLKLSPGAAVERVLLARQMEDHPRTRELLRSGDITYEQAAVVANSMASVATKDAAEVEARVLGATSLDAGHLREAARRIAGEVDAETLRADAGRAWTRRGLRIGPDIGGSSTVRGHITSEAAALWRVAAEPFMCPAGADDPRTKEQRLHDATAEIFRAAAGAAAQGEAPVTGLAGAGLVVAGEGLGSTSGGRARPGNGHRAQLVITVPLSALLAEDGPPALLEGRVPISREELDRCLCEADLTFLLHDARGNVAFQSRRSRLFSKAQERAIFSRYPTCVWPGCSRPSMEGRTHHLVEFNQGGESIAVNGVPNCFPHHDRLHLQGWALVENDDGSFRAMAPDDPGNPRTGLSPDEYLRRRLRAILEYKRRKRRPRARAGP